MFGKSQKYRRLLIGAFEILRRFAKASEDRHDTTTPDGQIMCLRTHVSTLGCASVWQRGVGGGLIHTAVEDQTEEDSKLSSGRAETKRDGRMWAGDRGTGAAKKKKKLPTTSSCL